MQTMAKRKSWLLPAMLILFILEVFTLPFVLGITYSGKSESPDHVLTYTENQLTWDGATDVSSDGVAELSLFSSSYQNVLAENGEKVVAPGTDGSNIVRLSNRAKGPVDYTALLYAMKSSDKLPVTASLSSDGGTDVTEYLLPDGISEDNVIRAVTGTVGKDQIQDFDINWLWQYYEDAEQDVIDTALGNKAALSEADDVTVGLYITVEDNNSYFTPDVPQTGNPTAVGMYVGLMVVSAMVLVFLLLSRRREKK